MLHYIQVLYYEYPRKRAPEQFCVNAVLYFGKLFGKLRRLTYLIKYACISIHISQVVIGYIPRLLIYIMCYKKI